MNRQSQSSGVGSYTEALRAILKSQYHATLAMLRETIERCPDDIWFSKEHVNSFWQVAYHTLFFAHLYIQPNAAAFRAWEHHQSEVQNPDGIAGPPDPNSTLPLIPKPYTKAELLSYWSVCDQMVDSAVDALDLHSPDSGFSWYKVPKLEHQIVNIRHIEHHMAQLADRLRSAADIGIQWVGAGRGTKSSSAG
jgi:DinB superfamily